ncbi:MAG: SET domain-containing protein [Kiritimatiellales bacterium]
MLLVKAWVGVSKIHGFGLIAHEFIPKETVVWRLVSGFDIVLSDEYLRELPPTVQEQVMHYSFFHPDLKRHVLSADDDRFTNHSDTANVQFFGDHAIAVRDIDEGEEITDNYAEFGKPVHQETRPLMRTT